MALTGIAAAFIVALLITLFVALILRSRGPWGTAWTLFVFLFLALWTVSLYVRSMGPVYLGVPWLPILFVGVLLTFLLLALPNTRTEQEAAPRIESSTPPSNRPVSKFFWILLALFVAAIIIGMVNPQMAH